MTRVDRIRQFKIQKELKEKTAAAVKENNITMYRNKITKLYPRIRELIDVGIACQESDIPLKAEKYARTISYETHQFMSDRISHLLGFIPLCEVDENIFQYDYENRGKVGGVGILDRDSLTIVVLPFGLLNIKTSGDEEVVLAKFLDEFEAFEKAFYNYVDEVTNG